MVINIGRRKGRKKIRMEKETKGKVNNGKLECDKRRKWEDKRQVISVREKKLIYNKGTRQGRIDKDWEEKEEETGKW